MPNPNTSKISQATRYQNAAIQYYLGLTNSPYLHYGYWEHVPSSSDEVTIKQLRVAQEAYAAKLLTFIPEGTRTILDVGCGIGGNAAYLIERGFNVEGLAPDAFQEERFIENTKGQAPFHLTTFEDFQTKNSYDLILLSESSQYIAAGDIAQCAARLLNPGGYLLFADMMRSDAKYDEGIFSNCHVVEDIRSALLEAGFSLVQTEDISKQIRPTLDLCIENFRTFGLSTLKYLGDILKIAVPPLQGILRWISNRWLKKLVVEGLAAPKIFDKHLCYQIQLWQFLK
jgi:MPBQ/MSBQ methyltransferase